jgi:hypothetical protein
MKSQSSLPIQYGAGSKSEISRGLEKNSDSSTAPQTSFQTRLNENIIDVYERSEVKAAVPDERERADRRMYSTRRQSSSESAPLQSGNKVTDINKNSPNQKTNQTYTKTEKTAPAIFSPSPEKGKLIDVWA